MENGNPRRKSIRLKGYDYSSVGAYFLTICTEKRQKVLSRIVGGDVLGAPKDVELLPYGEIADKYIRQLSDFYDNVSVDRYVIMPNHIHIMLRVVDTGAPRTSPPTVGREVFPDRQYSMVANFVSTFKRFCNREYGANIWQRYFNDHVIRNREDYEAHICYICDNPAGWYYDELYSEESP